MCTWYLSVFSKLFLMRIVTFYLLIVTFILRKNQGKNKRFLWLAAGLPRWATPSIILWYFSYQTNSRILLSTIVFHPISNTEAHCLVLILAGAKNKSDFQVHLDIQNLMLVLISNLHKFNKTFVHFTNNSAILPWYHF